MSLTSQRLHMRNRHSQNGELVGLPGQRAARWHHVTQLGYVGRHFVATSPLDFAMILSTAKVQGKKSVKTQNKKCTKVGQNNAISAQSASLTAKSCKLGNTLIRITGALD